MGGRRWQARRRRLAASALAAGALIATCSALAAPTLQERIAECVACHGRDGRSENPDIPHIGGQPKLFVMYQLFFYREGRRTSPEMNTVTRGISDAELTRLAEYVAALPPPSPPDGPVDGARYGRGAEIARQRQCGTCHNPDYSGRDQMPRVAGQREAYLIKSFKEYQAGTRVGTQAAMAEAVRGLDEAALGDLSYYLAHFRP